MYSELIDILNELRICLGGSFGESFYHVVSEAKLGAILIEE